MFVIIDCRESGDMVYRGFTTEPTQEHLEDVARNWYDAANVKYDFSCENGISLVVKETVVESGWIAGTTTTYKKLGTLVALKAEDIEVMESKLSKTEALLNYRGLYVDLKDSIKNTVSVQKELIDSLQLDNQVLREEISGLKTKLSHIYYSNITKSTLGEQHHNDVMHELKGHRLFEKNNLL